MGNPVITAPRVLLNNRRSWGITVTRVGLRCIASNVESSLNNRMILQVGETGKAVGIDHIDELVSDSLKNLRKDPMVVNMLESGQLKMVLGDGRLGYDADGPYDAIHVGAAAPSIPQAVSIMKYGYVIVLASLWYTTCCSKLKGLYAFLEKDVDVLLNNYMPLYYYA